MIEIKRNDYSVIAFDKGEERGIVFPTNSSVKLEQFEEEAEKVAKAIQEPLIVVILLYDPKYKRNHEPLQKFLEGKEGPQVLENDAVVCELYGYFFSHAIPALTPDGIDYIFVG